LKEILATFLGFFIDPSDSAPGTFCTICVHSVRALAGMDRFAQPKRYPAHHMDKSKQAINVIFNTAVVLNLSLIAYYSGPVLSTCITSFQEKSMCQILFHQKFGKPDLKQTQHEQNGCEKL